MNIALADYQDLQKFENEICGLIRRSEIPLAQQRVGEAIAQAASASLKAASDIPPGSVRIEGWRNLCGDLIKADAALREEVGKPAAFVELVLNTSPSSARLALDRRVFAAFQPLANDYVVPVGDFPRIGVGRPVLVLGLEAPMNLLLNVRRNPGPTPFDSQTQLDFRLAGLLVIVGIHRAFEDCVNGEGLPLPLNLFLQTNRSRPENDDLLPSSCRFIEVAAKKTNSPEAAATLLAERRAEDDADHQAGVNRSLAEMRELYRLAHMYPFYRFIGRYRLGGVLTAQLQIMCAATKVSDNGVGWRMGRPEFERLLRALAEATQVASVDDALDVVHVNALHRNWLKRAKAHGFEIPVDDGSLFELTLVHALKTGGPIVQERWETAQDYASTGSDAAAS